MEKPIRVAIVGVGGIATSAHIPAYKSNINAELVAVVDKNEKQLKRIAKKFKIKKLFSSVDELLENENIDAVSICTPPNTHAEIGLKSLNHGVNVLCEKPLATDVENGKKMVRVAKEKGKILTVGFHRRFFPNYQNARKCILEGNLGHVYCVQDNFIEPHPLQGYSKSHWFLEPNVGGVLFDIVPHVFDMLNYLFDDFPVALSAFTSTYLDQDVEDFGVFIVEYPRGRMGIGTASWLAPRFEENVNIYGTAQNLFVTPSFSLKINPNDIREIALLRAASETLVRMKFPKLPFLGNKTVNAYQLEINYFIDRVRNNIKSEGDALNSLSILLTTEAAQRSIRESCRVEILHPERSL